MSNFTKFTSECISGSNQQGDTRFVLPKFGFTTFVTCESYSPLRNSLGYESFQTRSTESGLTGPLPHFH